VTIVKICGLTDIGSAITAAEAGADLLGMVFAMSRRCVTPDWARSIADAVRQTHSKSLLTGVFVNLPAVEVNRLAEYCGLDRVQLSGHESWEYCREIERPVIKVVHVTENAQAREMLHEIEQGCRILKKESVCLLDTQTDNSFGGTGKTFNWKIAIEIAARFPVYIAGGLTPDVVGDLVQKVKPAGVDVSGGIETDGRKDFNKIKAFIKAVREADSKK